MADKIPPPPKVIHIQYSKYDGWFTDEGYSTTPQVGRAAKYFLVEEYEGVHPKPELIIQTVRR